MSSIITRPVFALLALFAIATASCSSTARAPGVATATAPRHSAHETAFLDTLEHRTFRFFWEQSDSVTGMSPDRWPTRSFVSVGAVGFALTAYPIGAERGWVSRDAAVERTARTLRWFWAAHVNHHSSQHYNLSTALRQTWTGLFTLSFAFRIWPAFIGFPPAMLLTCGAINLVYQFWIHTEAIGRMPRWFEALFNTPSHHRVHHATNPLYLDRNYAGVFIVWDKLLGSFQAERPGDVLHYGIVRQLGSFSLVWSAFHEWAGIAQDLVRAPWRYKLSYLLREPGWSHDDSRDSSAAIRARWQALQPDNPAPADGLAPV